VKTTSVRDLHLKTSAIVKQAAGGQSFVIVRQGVPVAELRPLQVLPSTRRLPNREARLARLPKTKTDSGRILEQDRS
jgi:antitoxin (DNA-binding transcriptional repressor) of toxin-antitoxin stability system